MENENSNEQKILGLVIDNKLKFESHINESCKKASQKIRALCRLSSHLDYSQKKVIFNSYHRSQIQLLSSSMDVLLKNIEQHDNKLHENSIRNVLNDCSSDFIKLLENNNDTCNHHGNVQTL